MPPADISWTRNGKKLKESSKYNSTSKGDTHTLTINSVAADFSGKIGVKAKNTQGTETCEAELTVEKKGTKYRKYVITKSACVLKIHHIPVL